MVFFENFDIEIFEQNNLLGFAAKRGYAHILVSRKLHFKVCFSHEKSDCQVPLVISCTESGNSMMSK